MTVITQPICEKKLSKQKQPLVEANGKHILPRDPEANVHSMVAVMRNRSQRVNSLTTFCVFLTALLIFATGLLGAFYVYSEYTRYKMKHFRGWCSVPFAEPQQMTQFITENHSLDEAMSQLQQSRMPADSENGARVSNGLRPLNSYFDEDFDIDIEYEEYERIEVPDFSHGRHVRFVHDFASNLTGIVDLEEDRCFLMPLNRTLVLPPHSLYDLVSKLMAGQYQVDTEVVRETYRVVTPPISNRRELGNYISRECYGFPVYKLEKMTSPVFKRSTDSEITKENIFAGFAGNKIGEFEIVNLNSIPGKQ